MTDHELFKHRVHRCGGDVLQFMQSSYYWKYQRHHPCVSDYGQYILHGIVPAYCLNFINSLENQ